MPAPLVKSSYPILDPHARPSAPRGCCALAMMIKAPQAGASKTRLVPPLSAHEAAALSVCFLRDTTANIAGISSQGGAEGVAVYTPVGAEAAFDNLLPKTFNLLTQRGTSFGERLLHAAEDLLTVGFESLCLIDSDSPTLPPALLSQAVETLARPGDRVVVGAAIDGGYYLIGLKKPHRRLFNDIDWSTPRVFSQTIERAAEINLEVEVLPAWYDVDDGATLAHLCEELFSSHGKGTGKNGLRGYDAFYTRGYIYDLIKTHGRQRIWPETVQPNEGAAKAESQYEKLAYHSR